MYNEVDTIIAKARYTTLLSTLISDFCYWLVLTGLVFGEDISFYYWLDFFFEEIVWTWGGRKERKGALFPSAIKNKRLDLGFGLYVCKTSKGAEKCRQLGAKPPLWNVEQLLLGLRETAHYIYDKVPAAKFSTWMHNNISMKS